MRSSVRSIRNLVVCAGVCGATSVGFAQAGGTINDGNVQLTVGAAPTSGTSTSIPAVSFSVDGGTTNQVLENFWWFRLSTDNREFVFNSAVDGASSSFSGNIGQMQQFYDQFRADITWEVESTGANAGFFTSRVTITNTSNDTISINLFNYTDADIGGTPDDDTAILRSTNLISISDALLRADYSGSNATNFQVASSPSLRGELTDASEDNFDNTGLPFAAGNFTGGYQWSNVVIDPGFSRSAIITFSIPSPGSLALAGVGLLALSRRRR
ncbi:MAG: PEP-CTERM sorting domain-containing protein [Planctomycetota bacterium]|nr:PEP-CTERM sorting domain-containing protein [Planctomycetota bacterium]